MTRLFNNFIIFFFALLFLSGVVAPSLEAQENKRVLVLYSLDKGHPGHILTEQGISEVFRTNKAFDVQLFAEYLDMNRFPGPAQTKSVADFLRRKYADIKIDVIVTIYPPALNLLLSQRPALFPDVPIIAGEITRSYARSLDSNLERRRITGTIMGDNAAVVLEAAIRIKPHTKRIALVAGSSPLDAYAEQMFRDALKRYSVQFELIDLTKLPMQETLERVGALPPDTIVLYSAILRDGVGHTFAPLDVLTRVSRASNAPVFYLYDTGIGHGSVGGRLISMERQGRTIADLALRAIVGEPPANIPFGGEDAYVNLYDWRELKRWQIPTTAIPAGAEIRFREPTLWEEYHWFVIGAISLTIIETLLVLGLLINLDRRKKAEQKLIESQMRLNLAVESADAGLWTLDMKTGRIWATDKTLVMYGFLPGESVTRDRFLSIVHEDDRERVVQVMAAANQNHKPFSEEYRINLPDGNVRWIAARGSYNQASGMSGGLAGASIDITERKQAEIDLHKEKLFSEALLESLPGLFYLYTFPEMRLIRWSKNYEAITGYGPEELYNRYALDWYAPADQEEVAEWIKKVIELGIFMIESNLIMKDGRSVPYLLTGARFQYLDQSYCMGVGFDISERKRMEFELQQKRNELAHVTRVSTVGQLASTLAHELNQPLGAILRNAEAAELFLQDPSPDLDELRAIMVDIRRDDQRAGEVIDRMRGLMRQRQAEQRSLDLNLLTKGVIAMVQSDADKRHVRLTQDIDPTLSPVLGDRVQLQQVLINLLLNAFDALDDNQQENHLVTVSARPVNATVEVAVSDNGPGIAADKLLQVFEPFFSSKPSGLGMGLAISRGIIEAHGGQLWVKNNETGGATFTFSLPVVGGNL